MPQDRIIRLSTAAERPPRCRLCEQFMEKHFDAARNVVIYACRLDQWAIRADDVFLKPGAWDRAEADLKRTEDMKEAFDCPGCRATMRFVCTSTGYMKWKCVKTAKRGCGLQVELKEPDRAKPGDVGVGLKDLVLDMTPEDKEKFS